ncbi:MAG: prepilin-type N-terminal cleavage/methylation domain-containing protein [Phycisphaerales bacterium]|nr:prepilin-type N-terminal cleavage/methylation domain-containing protein [Phycisphaerales bacterium]
MSERRAFSLIELLVTISIIAILLGIVLAAMPKVRQAGLRAACGANLHGIGLGFEAYKSDNGEKYPRARYMPPPLLSGDPDPPLTVALTDYIEPNNLAWRCPGDSTVYYLEYTLDSGETKTCGSSYTFVTGLSGVTFDQSFFARFLQRRPETTPVMYDFDGGTFELQNEQEVTVGFFHSERMALFVDGHVGNVVESAPPAAQ